MMETVHKFKLSPTNVIYLPTDAEELHVDVQDGDLCMWVRLDTEKPTVPKNYWVHCTGHEIGPGVPRHIGSALMSDGALVWHVFGEDR